MLYSGFMPLFNLREVTEISKVVDVMLPLGRKQRYLVHGTSGLQLKTGGGSVDNLKVDFY